MKWFSNDGSKRLGTLEVVDMWGKALPDSATIMSDMINDATILKLANSICEAIQDCSSMGSEFVLCFKRYGLIQLRMNLSEDFNWTADDWQYFMYDLALALIAVVRNYHVRCFKKEPAVSKRWQDLDRMEQKVLAASGNADAHRLEYDFAMKQSLKIAEC